MKPYYVLLSRVGNHGLVMVLNVRNFYLWSIDQEGGNADFALPDFENQILNNGNPLDNLPSRQARNALRDYIQRFRTWSGCPVDSGMGRWMAKLRPHVREAGWPDAYNRSVFISSRVAWEKAEEERWGAEAAIEQAEALDV